MPILAADIQYRLSGGASNTNPLLSLGGAISSTAVPTGSTSGIFDDVTSAEKTAGDVEYRCFYVRNNDVTRTAFTTKVWLNANTPSSTTTVDIGAGSAAINAAEPTTADESTAPSGVTFSAAADESASINVGDIPPLGSKSFWLRRTVNAGTADGTDTFTIRTKCDSNP